jgi:hypothetical protein
LLLISGSRDEDRRRIPASARKRIIFLTSFAPRNHSNHLLQPSPHPGRLCSP